MKPIIEVKNIGKKYQISHNRGGYVALRDVIMETIKHPFRFLKIKAKEVTGMQTKEDFWALKNINFTVEKGEAIGIIGSNGAGKSTLLKILSQITPPTEGEIIMRGKVGSLLEVGTGFHPELSGRENIFLNGAILGMTKKEIEKKFDKIVEFSGVERFLDTPVKRYSSGMYVRLAFAVAAHMEPDILIVDEVLAVGDAEFQKKCLGKMDEITKSEGRTVLFVSHNMNAIQSICKRCILLQDGKILKIGTSDEIISNYLDEKKNQPVAFFPEPNIHKKRAHISKIAIIDAKGNHSSHLNMSAPFTFEIDYELKENEPAYVVLKLFKASIPGTYITVSLSNDNNQKNYSEKGKYKATVKIDPFLNAGTYSILVGVAVNTESYLDSIEEKDFFSIDKTGDFPFPITNNGRQDSIILKKMDWEISKNS